MLYLSEFYWINYGNPLAIEEKKLSSCNCMHIMQIWKEQWLVLQTVDTFLTARQSFRRNKVPLNSNRSLNLFSFQQYITISKNEMLFLYYIVLYWNGLFLLVWETHSSQLKPRVDVPPLKHSPIVDHSLHFQVSAITNEDCNQHLCTYILMLAIK